jgi:hypothetical protein
LNETSVTTGTTTGADVTAAVFDDTFFAGTVGLAFGRLLRGLVTLLVVVVKRRVFGAGLLHGFAGRILADMACILVFLDVFVVRFFPNVFAALESGFLPADTLFEGGCGGCVEGLRFVVARGGVELGRVC